MTANIRFEMVLKEMEEKQRRIRLKWFEKYFYLLQEAQKEDEDVEIHPLLVKLTGEITKMRQERYARERETEIARRAELEEKRKQLLAEKDIIIPIEELRRGSMFPVDKDTKDKLYIGISSNREGRWLYLKTRSHLAPHEKYYEPQTMQNVYGWKIEERAMPADKQFARNTVIVPQFYRRTGVKGETLRNRLPSSGFMEIDTIC